MLTLVLTACTPPHVALPTPTGPFSVGYSALPQFYMTALYPAVEGTGRGTPTYFTPATLASTGLSDATLGDVIVSAEINAIPVETGPRPVAIIGPGGSSYVELSTSLAQELASHGYVVLLVQPDASAEGGFNLGTETPTEEEAQVLMDAQAAARIAQLVAALDLIDDPLATALVGEMDPTRVAVGGHSYGGHAAFATASQDARVSALFDLDGALYDETAEVAPLVPSLAVLAVPTLAEAPSAFYRATLHRVAGDLGAARLALNELAPTERGWIYDSVLIELSEGGSETRLTTLLADTNPMVTAAHRRVLAAVARLVHAPTEADWMASADLIGDAAALATWERAAVATADLSVLPHFAETP